MKIHKFMKIEPKKAIALPIQKIKKGKKEKKHFYNRAMHKIVFSIFSSLLNLV